MPNNMLTIGQLAKRTGETIRTLRYYDKIDLLHPSDYKEGGHRLYNYEDLHRLQKIQSLKFIGFSLKDIANLLEVQQTQQQHISHAIAVKKKELIAQLEETKRTIDQLTHIHTAISDHPQVDLSVFCFILHAIIWEENNLLEYHQINSSICNYNNIERVELDKKYFALFTELKQLVASETSPDSYQATTFIKKLVTLQSLTLEKTKGLEVNPRDQTEPPNILDPFTEEERIFIKHAFAFMQKSKGPQ